MRKIVSSVIALSMIFSVASALIFTETVSADIADGVVWKNVFTQDFEDGSNYGTYFTETASGERSVPGDVNYTNYTGDDLKARVKRIAHGKNNKTNLNRTLTLNETASPLYDGNAYADKADKVRIILDIARDSTSLMSHIRLVGKSGGSTVTTGTSAGNRFVCMTNRIYAHDSNETSSGSYRRDIRSFSASKWFKIMVDVDCSTDTYDIYIYDGGEWDGLWATGLKLGTDFDKIYGISVTGVSGGSSVTQIFVDNIRYYVPCDTYTVTLNTNGGTINADNVTSYTETVGATLPTNVTRQDYTFGGWFAESDCSGSAVTSISSSATGSKTFYAKWITNGTWDKVFSQDFESGSNWDTYFAENASNMAFTNGTGTYNVDGYTNNTGDALGIRVKRIASKKGSTRTLELNETASPLYDGNAYAGKADIVKISFDIAMEAVDKTAHIRLVGKSNGNRVQTGTSAGNRFIFMTKSGSYTKFLYHDSGSAYYYDGACRREDNKLVSAKTWYKITTVVNCITDTYDVYINDELREAGMKLDVDFDTIYGIELVATYNSDTPNDDTWTGTFIDNVRYYVPGSAATISSASYSSGTLSATVVPNSNTYLSNKVIVAAYSTGDENTLLGVTVTDVVENQNTYNINITGLASQPNHIKAFVWDFDDFNPSAKFAIQNIN